MVSRLLRYAAPLRSAATLRQAQGLAQDAYTLCAAMAPLSSLVIGTLGFGDALVEESPPPRGGRVWVGVKKEGRRRLRCRGSPACRDPRSSPSPEPLPSREGNCASHGDSCHAGEESRLWGRRVRVSNHAAPLDTPLRFAPPMRMMLGSWQARACLTRPAACDIISLLRAGSGGSSDGFPA